MSRALRQSICRDVIVLMEGLFVCLLLLLFLGGGNEENFGARYSEVDQLLER